MKLDKGLQNRVSNNNFVHTTNDKLLQVHKKKENVFDLLEKP